MNNKIKKFIKYVTHPTGFIILLASKNLIKMNDKKFLEIQFNFKMKYKLNLEDPKTFNEKLQWLKLYDKKDIYTTMVDKCKVKKYVANIIGEEYIIPTIGVYDKFKDINFEKLPNQFVLKCTHDSGGLIICKDKNKFNKERAKNKINKCLKKNLYNNFREWPYKNVKPRIIIEKYMATENQRELIDYKFFCFNGEPKFIYVSEGLSNHKTAKISFADMNYKKTDFYRKDYQQFEELPPKPVNFEKMKKLAHDLSKTNLFLRVDFYEIEEKIYFGELTFYPNAGFIPFCPEGYDKILGDMINLPVDKN